MLPADSLAINGGTPVIEHRYHGRKNRRANRVLRSGVLSAFIGAPGPGFLGGRGEKAGERPPSS